MNYEEEEDYYAPWEWQPIDRIPWGCHEVIVKYEDGTTRKMCSCDYSWSSNKDKIIQFRFD